MLRLSKFRFTTIIPCALGLTYAVSGQAQDKLPWEQPGAAPAPKEPAKAAAAEEPAKPRRKRRVAVVQAPAPAPAPAGAAPPSPAKPAPAPVPAAARLAQPAAIPAPKAASTDQQRLADIESALRRAGILEAAPSAAPATADQGKALEAEVARLEQQQKSLEAAIAGGVEIESVKAALADIRSRADKARAELAQMQKKTPVEPAGPKPPIVARLDAIEAQLKRIEETLSKNTAAAPTESKADDTKASKAEPAADAPVTSGYDEGFVLRSADRKFSLQPTGFVQVRYTHEFVDEADDRVNFSLPRARAGMKGTVFSKALKYNFLADFGKGTTQLAYFYGDYTFVEDYLGLRVGLFKRPFSRALLNASEKAELVSSPLTIKAFGDAHDIGVMAHNGAPQFEYAVGVFNGIGSKGGFSGKVEVDPDSGEGTVTEGDFSNTPERFHPTLIGRVAYNHDKIQGYSEADLEGGPLRFSIGGAGLADFDVDDDDRSFVRGTIDAVVKVEGFAAVAGGYLSSKQDGGSFGDRAYEATGALLQTGYVIAKRFQPVVRYTLLSPADDAPKTHEFATGFNVFFHKHALKWQNEFDLRRSGPDTGRKTDMAILSQFQLIF